ncbi:MAG: hypothetical protein IT309_08995 [Anaerolineales bacterium]|jgi:hypothetical protein|nr:hypothetical protein [Anaerolineales bacterium]
MKTKWFRALVGLSLAGLLTNACLPPSNPNPTATVDVIGTTAAQLASMMLTQTAAAYTPTPLPATDTPIPLFTDTPTLGPAPAVTEIPVISQSAACYSGPGPGYPLVSNLSELEQVIVMGVGSVPGWYVIENPYYGSLCWVSAEFVTFGPDFDPASLPTINPP